MTVALAVGSTVVHVMTPERVCRAALVTRHRLRGRELVRVWLRGRMAPVDLDPALVFDTEPAARRSWRIATAHRDRLRRAGADIRVIDAHLSLSYARELPHAVESGPS